MRGLKTDSSSSLFSDQSIFWKGSIKHWISDFICGEKTHFNHFLLMLHFFNSFPHYQPGTFILPPCGFLLVKQTQKTISKHVEWQGIFPFKSSFFAGSQQPGLNSKSVFIKMHIFLFTVISRWRRSIKSKEICTWRRSGWGRGQTIRGRWPSRPQLSAS